MYCVPVYCPMHRLSIVPIDDATCPVCDELDEEQQNQYDSELCPLSNLRVPISHCHFEDGAV